MYLYIYIGWRTTQTREAPALLDQIVDADDIQTPKQYLKNRRRVTKTRQRSINIFQGRSHQLTLAKADQKTIVKPSQIQKSTTAKPSESLEELIEQNFKKQRSRQTEFEYVYRANPTIRTNQPSFSLPKAIANVKNVFLQKDK